MLKSTSLDNILLLLARTQDIEHKEETIREFFGSKDVKQIYELVLKSSDIKAFVNLEQIHKQLPENISLFDQFNDNKNIKLEEIIEDVPYSRKYVKTMSSENYSFKFFPKGWNNNKFHDCLIFNNCVAVITIEQDNLRGMLVQNNKVYQQALEIFRTVWNLLPTAIYE